MKRIRCTALKGSWEGVMWGCIFFSWSDIVFAAEESVNWRSTYDTVMMWVNFLILVFLIVKFAGPFLKKFLNDQRDEVALEIEQLENQRDQLIHKVEHAVKGMENSRAHFQAVKEKIIAQGEAEKQTVIDDARHQSRTMLNDAARRIENQILAAKQNFRSELIDVAADLAMENIRGYITAEDNDRFLQQFMAAAGQ